MTNTKIQISLFYHRTGSVCPFECAALPSRRRRRRRRPFTRILGSARVQNGYRTGTHLTNENSKFQRSLAFTFTFHYSSLLPTTSTINRSFLLSCAHALHFTFSPYHREQERCVRLSAQHLLVVVVFVFVDLLPSFWAAHGCKTGIELVLT